MTAVALEPLERLPRPTLVPLLRLVDHVGIIEHSTGHRPDPRFGHCTDDAGRALGLTAELQDDLAAGMLASVCLDQLRRSWTGEGFHLRLDDHGLPTPHPSSDDATARAIWGLALASLDGPNATIRDGSAELLEGVRGFESQFPRAAAHAVIGAAALIESGDSVVGEQLLLTNIAYVPRGGRGDRWPWPEACLTYTNALLPEALLRAGRALDNVALVESGLHLLGWLVDRETGPEGHLSFTPVDRGVPSALPAFDQQPVEAWAMATAAGAAFEMTADERWARVVDSCARWFSGANDLQVPMWDDQNGAAYDGLTATGPNRNQGAESSIAFIGTLAVAAKVHRRAIHRSLHPSARSVTS